MRFTSSWAMAPSTPTTIVAPASTSSSVAGRVVVGEQQRLGADDGVHADLGEQAGEDRGHRRRRRRVAVGQPEEQREDGGLDAEHDEQQHGQARCAARSGSSAILVGEVGHVHRAGRRVDERERGHEQHRRQQADDHVGHARPHLVEAPAERDEHVAGRQHHLEGDEQVEQVAGEERRPTRPAASTRYTDWNPTWLRSAPGWPMAYTSTASSISAATTSMIAEKRSATSVMPIGAGHPPACDRRPGRRGRPRPAARRPAPALAVRTAMADRPLQPARPAEQDRQRRRR